MATSGHGFEIEELVVVEQTGLKLFGLVARFARTMSLVPNIHFAKNLRKCRNSCRFFGLLGVVCVLTSISTAQDEFSSLLKPVSAEHTNLLSRSFVSREKLAEGDTLFRSVPASLTGVDFQMQLPDMVKNVHELLHLSVMGGICSGDVDGDGLADLYVTSPEGGNRLFRNLGGFRFEDVTEASGLEDETFWGTGAVMVDIDGDGDLDIYACGYRFPNRLWINEGVDEDGRLKFENKAQAFGLDFNGASMNAAFADYDHDGDLDVYLATTAAPPPPGTKFRVNFEGERPVVPDELAEYWALVYLPGDQAHRTEAGQFDHLFRNDNNQFVDVSKAAGIDGPLFTLGVVWWDFNDDSWPDLYVANDYLGSDLLYINQRDGTFKELIRETVPHTPWSSMGMDIGDLNNDGLVDLIATDMLGSTHYRRNVMQGEISRTGWYLDVAEPRQYPRNTVLLNTGTSRMLEAAYYTGMAATDWTWAPRIEDFDEDGRVDVFFSNGMLRDVQHADLGNYADRMLGGGSPEWADFWSKQRMQLERNVAYRNLGGLDFEDVGRGWGLDRLGVSFGSTTADFDNDGDLDLAVNNADAPLSIYENRTDQGNRIRVRLVGTDGNQFGVGATVRLKTSEGEQVRYLTTTRGWLAGSEPVLHFGLGSSPKIESMSIAWPSGGYQEFRGLAANHFYEVHEPDVLNGVSNAGAVTTRIGSLFRETNTLSGIVDVLSTHDDFLQQSLLPYRISQTRYCMAWADVNSDGREDLFLGGGVGQSGRLFLQNSTGTFRLEPVDAFASAELHSDVDAAFFDADEDGDLDLFVVSGGVEIPAGHESLLQSRLYLNDGNGVFTLAPDGTLPRMTSAGSCVAVGDINDDGRPDLFVGGGPVSGKYPLAAPSRLLINRGGKFEEDSVGTFENVGLVTAAEYGDLNGDGKIDLIMTTEWGPVRVFMNRDGRLVEAAENSGLLRRTGWWRSLAVGDLDGDGDLDLVTGNLGKNTRYQPSEKAPDTLFYGKMGNNKADLLVEAYHENGEMFSRRGFDDLSRQQLKLRDKFLNFHEFSLTNLAGVFDNSLLQSALRLEVNSSESGVWLNDGAGRFTFEALPALAQLSPVNGMALLDCDNDGILDLALAQNDFSPDKLTGRFDGGLSLFLRGNGRGGFDVLPAVASGIVIPGEARRVAAVDLNGDGKLDLVFGIPGASMRSFYDASSFEN